MDSDDISEDIADDSTEATRKKLEKFKFSGVDIKKLGGSSTTKKEKISESPEKFEIKTAEFPSEKWDEITRFNEKIKDLDSKEKIEEIQKEIKDIPFNFISSVSNSGLTELKDGLWKVLNDE